MSLNTSSQSRLSFINIMLLIFMVIFLYMVRNYLLSLILALIFAALLTPFYNRVVATFKGSKKSLSAAIVTISFLLVIVIPSILLLEEIVRQALSVVDLVVPAIEQEVQREGGTRSLPKWLPFRDILEPYTAQILERANTLLGDLADSLVGWLSRLTQNTAVFLVNFFILLYAIYSFVRNGSSMIAAARKYLPISARQFDILTKEIVDVSRATLKGALVIGLIQGALVGISLWAAGLHAPVFWGAVAALSSLIPGIGAALVYIPAAVYLIATGHNTAGIGVLVWGLLVVGSVDNFLRPVLVGKDMEMSDVMVLVSTLGGIGLFGITGVILGPLVVGLLQVFINFSYQERTRS